MAGIFINYRRDDAPGVAGRLFDYLSTKYPRGDLFMDVDTMQPGVDFVEQLDAQVAQCRVLLAIIGQHWLESVDHGGQRRLDNDGDYVRVELSAALKRAIPVIPVLVDGAVMPPEGRLSDDLKPLARRHAVELRHTHFNADAAAIVHTLERHVPRRRSFLPLIGAGIAALLCIGALVMFWPKLSTMLRRPPVQVALSPPAPAPTAPPAQPQPAPPAPRPPVASVPPPASAPSAPTTPQTITPAPSPVPPSPAPAPALRPQPPPPAPVTALPGLPPGARLGEMMPDSSFMGSTLHVRDIPADPANCQDACRADQHCASWTYAQPPTAGQPARCTLKAVIPQQLTTPCCTSGIERAPDPELREAPEIPAGVANVLRGIDLFGGDYRSFSGPRATVEACQAACRAEGECLSWTYVRPGIFASGEQSCSLKGRVPRQITSTCCISGVERQTPAPPRQP
jgi:hypothetical protein